MSTVSANFVIQDKAAVAGGQSLRDGGFAFVRVVAAEGGGSYSVSLGGRVFRAASALDLMPDTVLRVRVRLEADRIILSPENPPRAAPEGGLYRLSAAALENGTLPAQLAERFAALGIPLDAVSLRLVAFLQQLGARADGALLARCRRIAAKFPGREEEAAEAALFLSEKGVVPDSQNVAALLDILLGGPPYHAENGASGGGAADSGDDGDSPPLAVFDRLYGARLDSLPNRPGLLTLMNHMGSGESRWIVLPFCLGPVPGGSASEAVPPSFHGNIRVLMDIGKKISEKIVISAQAPASRYLFVLSCNKDGVSELAFHTEPPVSDSVARSWCVELEEAFPSARVAYGGGCSSEGFFCDRGFDASAVWTEA